MDNKTKANTIRDKKSFEEKDNFEKVLKLVKF